MSSEVVVVAGAMAQQPGRPGHASVFLNWMLSLRRLGYRPLFVDRMNASMGDVDRGVRWVREVMAAHGFDDSWCVRLEPSGAHPRTAGLGAVRVAAMAADALLLNVMGYLGDTDLLARCARRVLLDIDPGFGQVWQQQGLADLFAGHDAYATVGLNVGRPGCGVPDLGIDWLATLPPVDLASWATSTPPGQRFTTVASWRGPFAPVELHGARHGLRAHHARQFADLPAFTGVPLEMALAIDEHDDADRRRLLAGGWQLADPGAVAADLDAYRAYIHGSLAELSIAKQLYVQLRTGWFSDRSACYLASGRPVIVSDTGAGDVLPTGEGLLVYSTCDGAAAALAEVASDPARHAKAAQGIAEEFFDGRVVVRSLLERAA